MKVLVTGGAGFIGSNLCEHLLAHDYEVVCLDNFITGKIENLLPLLNQYSTTFKLIVGDIRNISDCQKAVEGVDYVLHEAALGSVPRSVKDPVTTNDVNIGGFLNMLIAARDAGVKRLIYAASSSTYGDSKSLPKVEEVIGKPLSPYAITKYVNELYADVFARTYHMDCIGLRYFNVFGRRQDPFGVYAAVIPLFVKKLMAHESPVINGDGEYSRDFTYIDDIAEAIIRLQDVIPEKDPQWAVETGSPATSSAPYRVYNIGNSSPVELMDYINALEEALGIEANKNMMPLQPGDVLETSADTKALYDVIGFKPETSVKEGVKNFVEWYRNFYKV